MQQNTKDWMQHISAFLLIVSAIAMGFLAFIMTREIGAGPLTYIGEVLTAALAIFGVATYLVREVDDFKREIRNQLKNQSGTTENKDK